MAALSVSWFHLTYTYPPESWVRLSGHYGWVGVEAFFVISGLVVPFALHRAGYELRTGFLRFLAKRLMWLEPPYVLSIALVVVLAHLSTMVPGFRGSPPDFSV